MRTVQATKTNSNPSIAEIRARIDARAALAWRLAQLQAAMAGETSAVEGGAL